MCPLIISICYELDEVPTFFLGNKNGVSSALLPEIGLVCSQSSLGSAHGATSCLVGVSSTFQVILSRDIGALWLRRSLETKRGGGWRHVGRVLRSIALLFGGHVLFLGDQIVNAFVVLNHL